MVDKLPGSRCLQAVDFVQSWTEAPTVPDDHIITQVSGFRLWTLLYALTQNSRPHTGTGRTHRCWGLGGLLCNDQEPAGTLEDLLTAL